MKISISYSLTASSMPQIMFSGDLDRRAAILAEMGYDGLDLFIPQPKEANGAAIARSLEKNGLGVSMLAAAGDIMADGLFLNTEYPAELDKLLERAQFHLELCALLGAMPNIGFIRGKHPAGNDPKAKSASLARMAEGTRRYCDLARGFGVEVLLEPICRYEINSINTTAQGLELIHLAGNPANLGLLLDLFHMNIEEQSLCAALVHAGTRIRHVHFVDNTRAVPGRGCLPLADIVGILRGLDYQGYLGLEAIPGDCPEAEARSGLEWTKRLI